MNYNWTWQVSDKNVPYKKADISGWFNHLIDLYPGNDYGQRISVSVHLYPKTCCVMVTYYPDGFDPVWEVAGDYTDGGRFFVDKLYLPKTLLRYPVADFPGNRKQIEADIEQWLERID